MHGRNPTEGNPRLQNIDDYRIDKLLPRQDIQQKCFQEDKRLTDSIAELEATPGQVCIWFASSAPSAVKEKLTAEAAEPHSRAGRQRKNVNHGVHKRLDKTRAFGYSGGTTELASGNDCRGKRS
jgi:hypothetical protein